MPTQKLFKPKQMLSYFVCYLTYVIVNTMPSPKINIIIAYDQQLIADGLSEILSKDKDFAVIHSLKNEESVFDVVSKTKPDVVLFEFARWPSHYINYIREFSVAFHRTKLLVISELVSHDYLMQVMSFAHGYLLRTCSASKVIFAIHEVMKLGKYLCPQEIEEIVNSKTNNSPRLTLREEEVLSFWLALDDNVEIAKNLNISESTVRTHLKNIRHKINGTNKIQMMIYACKNNILNLGMEPICPNCKYSCHKLKVKCN